MKSFPSMRPTIWAPLTALTLSALFLLFSFALQGFYPFGSHTVSWCDMDQQVVPLLLNFRDIFTGHGSLFYSFQNAGGMNFWGVFFFFVASPFSFLTLLVPKSQMLLFMNILVILKTACCAATAAIYLTQSHPKLRPGFAVLLSLFYAFSGYLLLFYQNIIWLDMAYLFPLLLLSFEHLMFRQKALPYILVLSLMMIVNYYISYMIILFTLLYFGLNLSSMSGSRRKETAVLFLIASFIAALLTAVIWLPSFLQYLSSGRDISIIKSLIESDFFTRFETVLPILFPFIGVLAIILYDLGHRSLPTGTDLRVRPRIYVFLFILMLLPLVIEPINKMWHTGNYQSFPARYGFITIFIGIVLCSEQLQVSPPLPSKTSRRPMILRNLLPFVFLLLILIYAIFARQYLTAQFSDLTKYIHTLWGNMDSFYALLLPTLLSAFLYVFFYRSYYRRLLSSRVFILLCTLLFAVESYFNLNVYMLSVDPEEHNQSFSAAVELTEFTPPKEQDDSFYRVKLNQKYIDVNLLGGLSFPSLGHYTSLTSEDYMYTMKTLGYSSYWMEVGGYDGTAFSDAALSVAYRIVWNENQPSALFYGDTYAVEKTPSYLGLGIPTSESLDDTNELDTLTRLQVQELLFQKIFPGEASPFISYEPTFMAGATAYQDEWGDYQLEYTGSSKEGHLYYEIEINGTQTLYFDCFDKLSNRLSEPINASFDLAVNGAVIEKKYPSKLDNGLICLGTFHDETVFIDATLLQAVTCRSFGLFGLDIDKLSLYTAQKETLNLSASGHTIQGKTALAKDQYIFLSIPYDTGWTLYIDDEKTELQRAFMGFMSFMLPAGSHTVELRYTPPGFSLGMVLTLCGITLCVVFFVLSRLIKRKQNRPSASTLQTACSYLVGLLLLLVLLFVYFAPLLLSVLGKLDL